MTRFGPAIIADTSFLYFLLPFHFDETTYCARALATDKLRGISGTTTWISAPVAPVEAVLCHVRKYLEAQSDSPVFRTWNLDVEAVADLAGSPWLLHYRRGTIPFNVGGQGAPFTFQLALTSLGTGVLVIAARPQSNSFDKWIDFLHVFRYYKGQRETGVSRSAADLLPPETPRPFFETIEQVLATAALPGEKTWWREAFVAGQLLPYSGTFIDDAAQHHRDELFYRLHANFPSWRDTIPGEATIHASSPRVFTYAPGQAFFFCMDSCGFAGLNAPKNRFFRENLPEHLRGVYYLVVLICILQRFAILHLSDLVAQAAGTRESKTSDLTEALERARRLFHQFTASLYFAQVMHSESHHHAYRACQEAWLIGESHREVKDEIEEIHNFHVLRQTNALQEKVNRAVTYLAVPALFLAFLGVNWKGFTTGEGISITLHWPHLIGWGLFFIAFALVLRSALRKPE